MDAYQDSYRTLYNHDSRLMPELPDESVQMVVTSPPYWGLRKYAGPQDVAWSDGWHGAYGLEPTPGLYVQHSIEILREIKRVLRKDGVVFWNIGDSYAGSGKGIGGTDHGKAVFTDENIVKTKWQGMKPKDLCLIPFRIAIAAQDDGWWVRSVIIWNKQNPMPESVTDRPTESHEYIIMLTKSAKYYWDAEAVRENSLTLEDCKNGMNFGGGKCNEAGSLTNHSNQPGKKWDWRSRRNLRSVWTFPTQPYPEAHFATFPETLPERCIKAATPEAGCCSKCGKPWERIVERKGGSIGKGSWVDHSLDESAGKSRSTGVPHGGAIKDYQTKTIGWEPSCECAAPPQPSLVLDPFAGSGTTLFVAARMGRNSVGYELSEEYCRLIVNRNRQHVLV